MALLKPNALATAAQPARAQALAAEVFAKFAGWWGHANWIKFSFSIWIDRIAALPRQSFAASITITNLDLFWYMHLLKQIHLNSVFIWSVGLVKKNAEGASAAYCTEAKLGRFRSGHCMTNWVAERTCFCQIACATVNGEWIAPAKVLLQQKGLGLSSKKKTAAKYRQRCFQ